MVMDKRLEEFIAKSNVRHVSKYDYSKVVYRGSEEKVCIICPQHGEFWQTPQSHVRGNGCPICGNKGRGRFKSLSMDAFIEKSRKIHGDKYDYSKVEYINATTKVCIICPTHGEFWMAPINHIYDNKQGCPKCVGRGLSTDEIIEMFRKCHGDKYDYSKVEYVRMHDKVCIVCPTHGEFFQTPSKHLKGQGCPICGKIDSSKKRMKTSEQFTVEAKCVHGDKYDYSKVKYNGAFEKVCIICPIHGEFWQRPIDHLHGHGCASCNDSILEKKVENLLIDKDVEYVKQCNSSVFSWLGKQSLDFYLPKYNVAIECQGIQHFKPIKHFGGDDEFKAICDRDKRKLKLCEENGIKVIYYADYEYNFPYEVYTDGDKLLERFCD